MFREKNIVGFFWISFLTRKIEMLYLLDLGGCLENKPLAIAVGVDTAENGTSKDLGTLQQK